MSKDIGFLPGTKEEKMGAWVQPIFDNMKIAFSESGVSYMETMIERGTIEIESLSYIRGRSLPDTIFIVDEAQNITYHEAKAVLTRMGENSKIILLGDVEQIDAPHLDATSSGLTSIVELFKDFDESAHITLLKGERSRLATYAAKIL
jgi:PhoH-like ATPase